MLIITISGWIGMALILISYLLITTKQLSPNTITYQVINLVGAAGIIWDSVVNQAWPSAVFFIIWGCMAIVTLIMHLVNLKKKTHKNR
jgi:cyanate permease